MLRLLFSKEPVERGIAYQAIVGYFGAFEFDNYPLTLTERGAKKRYRKTSVEASAPQAKA
jgi:hypothetical protein